MALPYYKKNYDVSGCRVLFRVCNFFGKRRKKELYGSNNALISFLTFRYDKWEISPPFMTLDEKVGEGAFGLVYSGSVHKSVYSKLPYTKLHPQKSLISGKKNKVAAKLVKGNTFVFPYHCYFYIYL